MIKSEVEGAYFSQKIFDQIKSASTVSQQRKQQIRDRKTANVVVGFYC